MVRLQCLEGRRELLAHPFARSVDVQSYDFCRIGWIKDGLEAELRRKEDFVALPRAREPERMGSRMCRTAADQMTYHLPMTDSEAK
jgi:hypothetical protein